MDEGFFCQKCGTVYEKKIMACRVCNPKHYKKIKERDSMSITDPIHAQYTQRRGTWILVQGRETFYDEDNVLLEFTGEMQAQKYCEEVLKKPFGIQKPLEPKQGRLI